MAKNLQRVLEKDFLIELIAVCVRDKSILDVCLNHLKYEYIPSEDVKKLWKKIIEIKKSDGAISIGILKNHFSTDENILELLDDIKNLDIDSLDPDSLVDGLETFISNAIFVSKLNSLTELYTRGEEEKAIEGFKQASNEFSNFSIKRARFIEIFNESELLKRLAERKAQSSTQSRAKIPCGIPAIDKLTYGGFQKGEVAQWMALSGVGKSQLMVWIGVQAALFGAKVLHIQAEGTENQVTSRYDSAWTSGFYQDIKEGQIEPERLKKSLQQIQNLQRGNVYVKTAKGFDALSMVDIRKYVKDFIKEYGELDLLIVDYIDLIDPGDGHKYKPNELRYKYNKTSRQLKDIARDFNIVVHSPTQSSDIDNESKNDPNFVLTGHNLAEDRGRKRHIDFLFTLNQTKDEKKKGIIRIYGDKWRDYAGTNDFIPVVTNFDRGRFYSNKKTNELLTEEII